MNAVLNYKNQESMGLNRFLFGLFIIRKPSKGKEICAPGET